MTGAVANSYAIQLAFEKSDCLVDIPSADVSGTTQLTRVSNCLSNSGFTNVSFSLQLINTYQCDFTTTQPAANLKSVTQGLRIDMNASFTPSSEFRDSFNPNGYLMPEEMTLDYADIFKTLDYVI